jgi:origin recognition complex subunit 5
LKFAFKFNLRRYSEDADKALYTNFLAAILSIFTATCKSLHELRALLGPLWQGLTLVHFPA